MNSPVVDSLTWMLIGAAVLKYAKERDLAKPVHVPPRQNLDEPDVTRWRHNGTQPFEFADGNRARYRDETVYDTFVQIQSASG